MNEKKKRKGKDTFIKGFISPFHHLILTTALAIIMPILQKRKLKLSEVYNLHEATQYAGGRC